MSDRRKIADSVPNRSCSAAERIIEVASLCVLTYEEGQVLSAALGNTVCLAVDYIFGDVIAANAEFIDEATVDLMLAKIGNILHRDQFWKRTPQNFPEDLKQAPAAVAVRFGGPGLSISREWLAGSATREQPEVCALPTFGQIGSA